MCQRFSKLFESKVFCKNPHTVWDSGGLAVCRYDTIGSMRIFWALAMAAWCWAPLAAQSPAAAEAAAVFTEHPRLLLRPARLRLIQRERERTSDRWQQLDALARGGAPMPEPAFAQALYYRASGDAAAGRQAVAWALGAGNDLRQMAFVFDWCQDLLSDTQKAQLAARIAQRMAALAGDESVAAVRSRALAAVALYDDVPEAPQRELQRIVRDWWEGKLIPALKSGRDVLPRDDAYPLLELLHVIRENTNLDLRESFPAFFAGYPTERLMSYYPASYPAPENEFRIGAAARLGEPDLRQAALSRAADLALVAYDPNGAEIQPLQGWLMHDNFSMRGVFGAPYEFLWANPYQPGLTYNHLAPAYHDALLGKLFARSSWEEGSAWFGYFDGVAQKFENGRVAPVDLRAAAPVELDSAVAYSGRSARRFRVNLAEGQRLFIVALDPRRTYQVEIDDEEMYETVTDPGGIIEIDAPRGRAVGVRVQPAP
jgi:hypothetical protein